ncbi:hypothetical protein [Tenacibaculum amylolyticum]|uniref:hypothetical protein n=1 Tax=Tenacibaculum amylolyticum TaxID=104269 RepID=UPI003895ED31
MSFLTKSAQPLKTLHQGQTFVKSLHDSFTTKFYIHVASHTDVSEVEIMDGVIEFMNPNTLVYAF